MSTQWISINNKRVSKSQRILTCPKENQVPKSLVWLIIAGTLSSLTLKCKFISDAAQIWCKSIIHVLSAFRISKKESVKDGENSYWLSIYADIFFLSSLISEEAIELTDFKKTDLITDNFLFELGCRSLTTAMMKMRIQKTRKRNIPIKIKYKVHLNTSPQVQTTQTKSTTQIRVSFSSISFFLYHTLHYQIKNSTLKF